MLLVLIGERWLTVTDRDGRRRLDNTDDVVRLEIETALERGIRVIPILVEGATMPRPMSCQPAWRSWSAVKHSSSVTAGSTLTLNG